MNDVRILEEKVRQYSEKYGEDIIGSVKALAEIDIRIKGFLDEIERLDDELVRQHNDLADKINSMIKRAVDENSNGEEPDDSGCSAGEKTDLVVKMDIRIVRISP